jgi:hypothetical protein
MTRITVFDKLSININPKDVQELVMLCLTVLALVIAFSQVLLQYIGGTAGRAKSTFHAIGPFAKHIKKHPSLRIWKLTIRYPVLDMTTSQVTKALSIQKSNFPFYFLSLDDKDLEGMRVEIWTKRN